MEQYFPSAKYICSTKNDKRSYLASERSEESHNLVGCLVGDGHVKGPVEHVCNFFMKILHRYSTYINTLYEYMVENT